MACVDMSRKFECVEGYKFTQYLPNKADLPRVQISVGV